MVILGGEFFRSRQDTHQPLRLMDQDRKMSRADKEILFPIMQG